MRRNAPITSVPDPQASALHAEEFAPLIASLGPFEANPVIAVAVSGGRDSMALLRLLHDWAPSVNATLVAVTVDHGLRPDSASEALQVEAWSRALGIEHIVLHWVDREETAGAIQERARAARYTLLADFAASRNILHIALAHHADDQAETVLLRFAKGSGNDGLAGMTPISELAQVRILRPLLGITRDRLGATCVANGQRWIDDPSNMSAAYARPRLRTLREGLAAEGLTNGTLGLASVRAASTRQTLEILTAKALAESAEIYPQGFVRLDRTIWLNGMPEIARRVLGAIVRTVGGSAYLPTIEKLDATIQAMHMPDFSSVTLGHCLIERTGDLYVIMREIRNLPAEIDVPGGLESRWDRFLISSARPVRVGPAVASGLATIAHESPRIVQLGQPVVRDDTGAIAIPTLGLYPPHLDKNTISVRFAPRHALTNACFAVV